MADKNTVTRLLVPLDESAESRRALGPALRIAEPLNLPVELVTVYEPVNGRWAHDLDDVADREPYDQVEVAVVGGGWPGEVITDMAAEQPGTLICMSARHRDRVDRLVLGSVSTHVIRSSAAPFLFVGPSCEPIPEHASYRRLVVCLDDSARADTAMTLAAGWAHQFDIDVELVHVAPPTTEQAELEALGTRLSEAAGTLSAEDISATATLLTGDDPAECIAELLHSRQGALALTATHGRSGLSKLLLGSVSAELLLRSPSPMLITRSL